MTTDASQNLWRFIRLDQYSRPSETSGETMRKGIAGLWLRLGWGSKAQESVFDEKELSQVPQELVNKAAPDPDWSASLAEITAVLDIWLDAEVPGSSNQIFVGPPYHGTSEILTAWARAREWRLIAAPSPEMILTGGQDWLTQLEEDKDYISSLIAGIVAIYERPYRVGDWVTIDGAYGEVQSLSLRALRLYTPDDTVVCIPHIKIWTTNIFNENDGNRNLLCVAHFYVDPDHDAVRARQILNDVALTSPYLDLNHRIRVIVQGQPWGTHNQLKTYPLDCREQLQFISDLTVRGKGTLAKIGVKPAGALPAPSTQDYSG